MIAVNLDLVSRAHANPSFLLIDIRGVFRQRADASIVFTANMAAAAFVDRCVTMATTDTTETETKWGGGVSQVLSHLNDTPLHRQTHRSVY